MALLDLLNEEADPEVMNVMLEQAGDIIGPYTLIKKLGEGGFGIVWLADQTKPIRRKVAVKVIRPGMDSLAVLSRFRAERRALERMSHPNIATVLDAGTTPLGRPFFVLEWVDGKSITTFCQEADFGRMEKVKLFMDICRAVQHAHQRAVLHRDLKPSNILVAAGDAGPVAKIIDFGIAKALAADTDFPDSVACTVRGMLMGTPEYMAPEQAMLGAEVVDVRVDVYSLGAILYQLMTGVSPLESDTGTQKTSLTSKLQRIYEVEPLRPSLRVRQRVATEKYTPCTEDELKGDLDWIILKALEKNPEHRYASANALSDDLERHLKDEPVSAGPPDRWYRLQKLVRRNKTAFLFGATIGINLLILAGISVYAFMQESKARAHAEQLQAQAESNSRKAQALSDYLTQLLSQAGEFVRKGKNPEALRLALNESARDVESLNDEPELQIELLQRLIGILTTMGDNLSAYPLVKKQHEVAVRLYGENDPRTIAEMLTRARVTSGIGDKKEALRLYNEMDKRWASLGAAYVEKRNEALRFHAKELARQGRGKDALALVKEKLLLVSGDSLKDTQAHLFLADLLLGMGDLAPAEKAVMEAIRMNDRLGTEATESSRAMTLRTLSRIKAMQGDHVQAALHLEESIRIGVVQSGAEHHSLVARWIEVARHYIKSNRVQDAFRATDEAIQISQAQGSELMLPRALRSAAEIREEAGQLESALAFRRECMKLERLHSTDRGKWLYELSEIVRLESILGLYADVERDVKLLWEQSQTEPAVTTDPPFMRSICKILTDASEKWQIATGKMIFKSDILEWKTIMEQGVVQQ
jgi:serine/threonine protein kinase